MNWTCGDAADLNSEYARNAIENIIKNEKFKDYTINVTVASSKGENFLGILKRIKVTGTKEDGEKDELNLMMKLPLDSVQLREKFPVDMMYNREVAAYNVILPKLVEFQNKFNIKTKDRFKFIKCYDASAESFKEYLVFNDMQVDGYKMSNRKQSLDATHLKLALNSLANLHAISFAMKHNDPDYFSEFTKDLGNPMTMNPDAINYFDIVRDRALAVIDDAECKEKLEKFGVDLYGKMIHLLNCDTTAPYNVVCHGDSWNNNLLFKYDGSEPVDIILLDWQIMRHASPITDIAYLIFTGTDEKVRHDHYDELLDYYYERLKSRLREMDVNAEDVYPERAFRDNLKNVMPFGLLMAIMLMPILVGEMEDVPDMDEMLNKEKLELSDVAFENKQSALRYEIRMRGVVKDCVRMAGGIDATAILNWLSKNT